MHAPTSTLGILKGVFQCVNKYSNFEKHSWPDNKSLRGEERKQQLQSVTWRSNGTTRSLLSLNSLKLWRSFIAPLVCNPNDKHEASWHDMDLLNAFDKR
mmetsp:Transcript_18879/g.41142  ORF Transcript_18879/g.41142 Transcript_18879/m.41142 type:complete len:99 (-) Transcript_18879:64-360(-)